MKKNALIVSLSHDPLWEGIEKAILSKGLQILRVGTVREALFRLEQEAFSVLLVEDDATGEIQRQLARELGSRPFGLVTPVLVIGRTGEVSERALLTSLLDQYFPITTDPDVLADFVAETHELRKQKAKKGRIGTLSVPQILYQASRLRFTGAIVVERGEEKCVIYLENGIVGFASSNRDENRFGEFLMNRGIITRDQFDHAVKTLEKGGKRIGRILVDEGYLKPQVLQTLLLSQIKHIVFTVFDWVDGEFYILPDEMCKRDIAIAKVEAAPLILEGVKFKFNESQLNAIFSPFNDHVSLAMSIEEIQKRMHLGKDEGDFLQLVGQGRSVEELLSFSSFSRLESMKLLYGFRILGLLSFQKGTHPAAKSMPTRDERAKAIGELFSKPVEPQPAVLDKKADEKQIPQSDVKPRAWKRLQYVVGGATALVAFILFTVIATLFDTTGSKDGHTSEPRRIQVPNLVIETQQIQVVNTKPEVSSPTVVPTAALQPPKSADVNMEIVSMLESAEKRKREGRLHEAVALYRKIQEKSPDNFESWVGLGEILFDLERSDEALDALNKAQNLDKNHPRPYLTIGTIYLMRSQKADAKTAFHSYLALVKTNAESRARITEVRRILQNLESQK